MPAGVGGGLRHQRGTSPYDVATLQFTPPAQGDYYFLTSAIVGGHELNGTAYNGYYDLTADGTSVAYEQKGFKDNTDRLSFAAVKRSSLTVSAHVYRLRVWSGASANPDAGMGAARIIALSQAPPQPVPGITGSLGKSEDGWSGAVPVYAALDNLAYIDYPYARAKVTTPTSRIFYAPMSWNGSNNRFEGPSTREAITE